MKFGSNVIKVYPAANRSKEFDYGADLNLEQNIVSQITNITDYDSFIIEGLDIQYVDVFNRYCITPGKAIINGYLIDIIDPPLGVVYNFIPVAKYKDSSSDNPYILSDLKEGEKYKIYLKLNFSNKVIENLTIKTVNGYDEYGKNYIGSYTGLELIVSTEDLPEDFNFKIATISKDGTVEGISKGKKFKASNTSIEIDPSTGLVSESYKGSFGNWLENRFIIDDGIIS